MPPAVKKLKCTSKVKNENTLKVEECGTAIPKGMDCPNKKNHMMVYPTGFCQNGDHEGTARKSYRGNPKKSCPNWMYCPCQCHIAFDQLFAMSGRERTLVDNSGYSPDRGGFVMPSMEERARLHILSRSHGASAPIVEESPAPDLVPATIVRSFAPTTSGRAAPGELELWVKQQCDIWLVENEKFPCTPAYLSVEIGKARGVNPPSVGAISAVFDRWTRIGFGQIEKKPTRFVRYTEQGIQLGLEGCKEKFKRSRRSAEAAAGRRIG